MRGFFEARLAPIVSDLSLVVVSLGLISVSLGYVNAVITDPGVAGRTAFWIRVLALAATVGFTTYNLLAYAADIDAGAGDGSWAGDSRSPSRIIALFLIDLVMLGLQGWMYGVLVLRDFSDLGRMDSLQSLQMSPVHFLLLGAFAAGWHLLASLWHALARGPRDVVRVHLRFFVLFGILAATARFVPLSAHVAQFAWIGIFSAVVLVLFFSRGRGVVAKAIAAHARRDFRRGAS